MNEISKEAARRFKFHKEVTGCQTCATGARCPLGAELVFMITKGRKP